MKTRCSYVLLSLCFVALVLAASCMGLVLGTGSNTDLELTFLLNAYGKDADGASRLLLPAADRLVVILTPSEGPVLSREVAIGAGQNTVSISFPDLAFGDYALEVSAYKGTVNNIYNLRFQKKTQFSLGPGVSTLAVNLLPAGAGNVNSVDFVDGSGHIYKDLAANSCYSSIVPADHVASGTLDCFVNGRIGLWCLCKAPTAVPLPTIRPITIYRCRCPRIFTI